MIARKCILIFEDTVYILLDLWNSLPVASKFDVTTPYQEIVE